ncbi:MAG: glycosyltransferase [Alphaproteobacteria bacterium]|nr:glycosyltransferase [Alphaproteobacteria bacterium]
MQINADFSVIIPTRNRPVFLAEAVASILAQNFKRFEILVVNDGEGSIGPFDDKRIRVLDNHQRGAVAARNFGVTQAKGKYIAFLDDDDYFIDTCHLTRANAALNDLAEFFYANGTMMFPDGRKKLFARRADASSLRLNNTILVSTICYHASLHQQLGLFDETLPYYWDWDWYLRVAGSNNRMAHSNRSAVAIRVHQDNMSGQSNFAPRRANLDQLSAKHGLGCITLKNHLDFVVPSATN